MKSYANLYTMDSPQKFVTTVESDIISIEQRIDKIEQSLEASLSELLGEYERLAILVEQKAYNVLFTTTVNWTPDSNNQDLTLQNFYPCEQSEGEIYYCWTGPAATSKFNLHLDRTVDLKLKIQMVSYANDEIKNRIQLQIDGESLDFSVTDNFLIGIIPKKSKSLIQSTTISIDTGITIQPSEIDIRLIGVSIAGLFISPNE